MSVYQNNDVKEDETSRTLSLIVDNQPGTLARVIGLFFWEGVQH
jgi:acetolactate synthase small subunit